MNNVTYNGNKLKRIYVNDKLADDIKYNNKTIVGYRQTSQVEEDCYIIDSGSNYQVTNNSLTFTDRGELELRTKFICNGLNFTFNLPASDPSSYYEFDIAINGKFSVRIEVLESRGTYTTAINGVKYSEKPSSIYNVGNHLIVRMSGSKSFTLDMPEADSENAYGSIKVLGGHSGEWSLYGGFNVCDQYPVRS